jgi:hypothetical protein
MSTEIRIHVDSDSATSLATSNVERVQDQEIVRGETVSGETVRKLVTLRKRIVPFVPRWRCCTMWLKEWGKENRAIIKFAEVSFLI